MNTGDEGVAQFGDVQAALRWLRERPQFVEVLRPVDRELDGALERSFGYCH